MKISGAQPQIVSGASKRSPSSKMPLMPFDGAAKQSGAVASTGHHKGAKINVTA